MPAPAAHHPRAGSLIAAALAWAAIVAWAPADLRPSVTLSRALVVLLALAPLLGIIGGLSRAHWRRAIGGAAARLAAHHALLGGLFIALQQMWIPREEAACAGSPGTVEAWPIIAAVSLAPLALGFGAARGARALAARRRRPRPA